MEKNTTHILVRMSNSQRKLRSKEKYHEKSENTHTVICLIECFKLHKIAVCYLKKKREGGVKIVTTETV